MKIKLLGVIFLAVLLTFGLAFTSCGDGSELAPPKIPTKYAGTWDSGGFTCLVIKSNGTGTALYVGEDLPCTYVHSVTEDVDILTMIIDATHSTLGAIKGECAFKCSIDDGKLVLAEPLADAGGIAAQLAVYATVFSPYTRHVTSSTDEGTPITGIADIVGSWKATKGDFTGQVVFIINADGNGKTMLSATGVLDDCTWAVEGNKVTLEWDGTIYSLGIMSCTFDGSLKDGKLILANADGSPILSGYAAWGPFEK